MARVKFSCFLNTDNLPLLVLLIARSSMVSGTAELINLLNLKKKIDIISQEQYQILKANFSKKPAKKSLVHLAGKLNLNFIT